jgi:hypothetical protein
MFGGTSAPWSSWRSKCAPAMIPTVFADRRGFGASTIVAVLEVELRL